MTTDHVNPYHDRARADAYAGLEFPGTYYLAYRDLPAIIGEHVTGPRALDFGCGAGRSTRFLRRLGFDSVVGVDISEPMVAQARARDPDGDYRGSPTADRRPVEDTLWTDEGYREVYRQAGLELVETARPLGTEDEPYPWVTERTIPPWAIYVLRRGS